MTNGASESVLTSPRRFFVRDDDAGALTDELAFFVQAFMARRIPVSYQIIPARLTQECADFLLAAYGSDPELIEFGQHGLRHEMEVRGRRLNREFGPERSRAEQKRDIEDGLAQMQARLGHEVPIKVFTPPQHKYDRSTVEGAAEVGHRFFSAASYATTRHQLIYALGRKLGLSSIAHHGISYDGLVRPEGDIVERSISIAVDDGKSMQCPAQALPGEISAVSRDKPVIGLMFHHAVYKSAAARRALLDVADALVGLGVANFAKLGAPTAF